MTTPTKQQHTFELYQIDAFTDSVFGGNPACIVPLFQEEWLSDDVLLNIAQENAVAETAFLLIKATRSKIPLRWWTPEIEMDLCGHATLAAAHYLAKHCESSCTKDSFVFDTVSGDLTVQVIPLSRSGDFVYRMDFPSRMPLLDSTLPDSIRRALSHPPKQVYKARDYILLYDSEDEIRNLSIQDRQLFDQVNLDPGGVCVTAPAKESRQVPDIMADATMTRVDFVSRFFTPQASILEDPVTGSAHCSLIPFWAQRLEKNILVAQQLSDRVGTLYCKDQTTAGGAASRDDDSTTAAAARNRVYIMGRAKTYFKGEIYLEY